ncbi:hypothetical protein SDC9_202773 [bioreactor metagenome]|uniref:Uncharacterized protein n=1 Tax=bioreactor metagenome TaxID=1076179 RepID=A0A645J3M6_9ZZZZ
MLAAAILHGILQRVRLLLQRSRYHAADEHGRLHSNKRNYLLRTDYVQVGRGECKEVFALLNQCWVERSIDHRLSFIEDQDYKRTHQ